jgi:hypothetical protein
MTILPVTAIQAAAVITGVLLVLAYLRRVRRPVLTGAHLLLGAGALEQIVLLVAGTQDTPAGKPGIAAAAFLGAALGLGLLTSLIARNNRARSNVMVTAHVGLGAAGTVLSLAWAAMRDG